MITKYSHLSELDKENEDSTLYSIQSTDVVKNAAEHYRSSFSGGELGTFVQLT
jgi:hypothetical protein